MKKIKNRELVWIIENLESLVVSLASFQLENNNSVGVITATNQRRAEDSEKYKYRVRFTNHIRTEMIYIFTFFILSPFILYFTVIGIVLAYLGMKIPQ